MNLILFECIYRLDSRSLLLLSLAVPVVVAVVAVAVDEGGEDDAFSRVTPPIRQRDWFNADLRDR